MAKSKDGFRSRSSIPFCSAIGGVATRELRQAALAALGSVGLAGFERRPIGALSAGQFQRVLFARLVVQDAGLILLDEPFGAVDWRTSEDLLGLIERWRREGRTAVAVMHDSIRSAHISRIAC